MFENIASGSKALLAPTSLLGLLALLLGIAFWGMRLQDDSLDHALHSIVRKTNAVAHVRGGATAAHARTYRILTHIEARFPKPAVAREIQDVQGEMKASRQALDEMSTLPGLTPHELTMVKRSADLARDYQELMQGTVDIALIEPPQGVVFMLAADKKFVELMDSLDLLQKTQDSSLEASYTEIKRITQKILALLMVVGIGALALFFTRMAGRSQAIAEEKRQALEVFNRELETRVEERTRQWAEQVAERKKAEEKYRAIFEHATEGIFQTLPSGRVLSANLALAGILGYDSPAQLQDAVTDIAREVYADPSAAQAMLALIERHGAVAQHELAARRKDGSAIWLSITARSVRDEAGKTRYYEGTLHDITQRKAAEAERQEMQRRLLAVSRQAGMAEIAANVLHNVGNILNSVNISAGLVSSRLRDSKVQGLARAVQLIDEHAADLGDFLSRDAKGQLLPAYLGKLAQTLAAEQQEVIGELGHLTRNIDHIKDVVATQQAYAGSASIVEPALLADLLEDALRISDGAVRRDQVSIVKRFAETPLAQLDKTRVMQILVNLINNAKQAMDGASDRPRRVTLQVDVAGDTLRVGVRDEGKGIAPQDLTRIFAHGFTTRAGGHGFGLHSCALAAQQMGGTLSAQSDGPGQGALFLLELPLRPCCADDADETRGPLSGPSRNEAAPA